LNDIDTIIRDPQKNIDDVLSLTDEIILGKGLGLTQREISIINGIWKKLSGRRLNRARSSKKTGKQ
jgi:adenine-specific DNA-methyltransferase